MFKTIASWSYLAKDDRVTGFVAENVLCSQRWSINAGGFYCLSNNLVWRTSGCTFAYLRWSQESVCPALIAWLQASVDGGSEQRRRKRNRRDIWPETCPDRKRKELLHHPLDSVFTRGQREVFLWQWLRCDRRITHTCRQVPAHALCVSLSSSGSKSSALAKACRWAQPRPSHAPLSTPGGYWGERQPGTRRPSFPAWRLSCNLGDTRYFFLRKRPRLSVQDTAGGCQPPKQGFWVRTKQTWRVKNNTKTIACFTSDSPWKGEEFWCARHVVMSRNWGALEIQPKALCSNLLLLLCK